MCVFPEPIGDLSPAVTPCTPLLWEGETCPSPEGSVHRRALGQDRSRAWLRSRRAGLSRAARGAEGCSDPGFADLGRVMNVPEASREQGVGTAAPGSRRVSRFKFEERAACFSGAPGATHH